MPTGSSGSPVGPPGPRPSRRSAPRVVLRAGARLRVGRQRPSPRSPTRLGASTVPTPGRRARSRRALRVRRAKRKGHTMTVETISEAESKFRADPGSARGTPTVTATLAEGRAHLAAGPFSWEADLPTVIGGTNQAPSPTAYLLGALAGCGVAFLQRHTGPAVRRANRWHHGDRTLLDGPPRAARVRRRVARAGRHRTDDRGPDAGPGVEDRADVRGVAGALPDLPRAPQANRVSLTTN